MKFGVMGGLRMANKILLFQKSKMEAAAILKICNISATEQPILVIFSTMMSLGFPDTDCH